MNYNQKALIIGALIMMALPNIFMAMEEKKYDPMVKEFDLTVLHNPVVATEKQRKDEARFELFNIIDKASFKSDIEYEEKLKKILDRYPELVNVLKTIQGYGVVSPLEYATRHLEYGIEKKVLGIMSLLVERGAKISSSVIEDINNEISSLANSMAESERRINQVVDPTDTIGVSLLKVARKKLIKLKPELASFQELKSYLQEKMQKQQIEAARILDWQKAHPETSSIEYLESLKRK